MKEGTVQYWNERYKKKDTPWDIGYASPALIRYCKEHISRDARILIPGAGRAHELDVLYRDGYVNTQVCDWSETALQASKKTYPDLPEGAFIQGDFFAISDPFDLILEQTFFCAIPRSQRKEYVRHCAQLLGDTSGRIAGLLFDTDFGHEGPPHGGDEAEYRGLFEQRFDIEMMEPAKDSIAPRLGNELFFVAQVKPDWLTSAITTFR